MRAHQLVMSPKHGLLISEREEPSEESLIAVEEEKEDGGGRIVCQVLDYKALDPGELARSCTIKLEGTLEGYPIVLLVGSGASHNFVAKELVDSLGLKVTLTDEFSMRLGNGSSCASRGICKALTVKVGRNVLTIDAYVLERGGEDIVLGVAWLKTCGKTTTIDWKKKTISFEEEDAESIQNRFPFFCLEDKTVSAAVGNDRIHRIHQPILISARGPKKKQGTQANILEG